MNVLALDPGKTTGAVIFTPKGVSDIDILDWDEIEYEEMPQWLFIALDNPSEPVDLVVVEKYTISQRTIKSARHAEPLDVIGGAKFLAALGGIDVRVQMASDAKTAYPDKRLRELGLYSAVGGRHARDALRHALLSTHSTRTV